MHYIHYSICRLAECWLLGLLLFFFLHQQMFTSEHEHMWYTYIFCTMAIHRFESAASNCLWACFDSMSLLLALPR